MLEGFDFFQLANSGIQQLNWGRWFGRPSCLTPARRAPKTGSLDEFRNSASEIPAGPGPEGTENRFT